MSQLLFYHMWHVQEGGRDGVGGEEGWEVGGRLYLTKGSSAVSSISDIHRHNPQGRMRQWLAAIWQHTSPY